MGTYTLNAEQIADAMVDVEQKCEGDFYEEDFYKGAEIYIERLREDGAYIFDGRGKFNCQECGRAMKKVDGVCKKCKGKKKDDEIKK